jgi:hypothetical protein
MHHRIDTILIGFRQDIAGRLDPDSIRDGCRRVGHRSRRCVLDPVVHWFVLQAEKGSRRKRRRTRGQNYFSWFPL